MICPILPGFTVRPMLMADAAAWAHYVLRPDVMQHTSMTETTLEQVQAIVARCSAGEPASPLRFAVVPDGAAELVATIGFHTIHAQFGTAEIAYDVAPSHWGRGIATAACRAVARWGFEVRGWNRIQGTVVPANVASLRVLEHCGFQREGLLRRYRKVRGVPADYWMYSVLPGELT